MIIHRRRRPNACFVSCSSCSCALLIFTAAELNVFTIDRPFDILLTTTSTETAVIETLSGDPRSACIKISHESITTTIDRTAQRACIEVCESERERLAGLFVGAAHTSSERTTQARRVVQWAVLLPQRIGYRKLLYAATGEEHHLRFSQVLHIYYCHFLPPVSLSDLKPFFSSF
jgi:hypothetical protein